MLSTTHVAQESSKDRLILAALISASIHIYLLIPDKYYKISTQPLSNNLQLQLAKNNFDLTAPNKKENPSIKGHHNDSGVQKITKKDILKNIYVPEEITDNPAKIMIPFFEEPVTSIEYQEKKSLFIQIKLWVNRLGTIDKIEVIESNADETTLQVMLDKIKLAQFEPAIFKGNKVNSMITGRIEVEY